MKSPSIKSDALILDRLYDVILERKECMNPDSYVASLFIQGKAKIHEKVREESEELIEASGRDNHGGIVHEAADLMFHTLALLGQCGIRPDEIWDELARRWGVSGIKEKERRKPAKA